MRDAYQDLKYGLRTMRKAPGVAVLSILALTLGIGAVTAIFSILNSLLLKPLPVADPQRLVVLGTERAEADSVSYQVWTALRDRAVLPAPVAWATDRLALTEGAELTHLQAVWASGDLFAVLGVPAALGRTFDRRDDRRGGGPDGAVAVISHAFWQRHFGGGLDVVGRRLSIERVPVTVVGVAPRGFVGLDVGASFDVLLPLEVEPLLGRVPTRLDNPYWPWLRVMGRLGPDQTVDGVAGKARAIQAAIRQQTMPPFDHAEDVARYLSDGWVVRAASSGVSRLRPRYDSALRALLVVSLLVLLVACTSIAMLMLARSSARRVEFGVRRALGASASRLVRQQLIENLPVTAIGAGLGVWLAQWGSRTLVAQLSTWASPAFLDLSTDGRVLGVTVTATAATAMLSGLWPAYKSARASASEALQGQSRSHTSEARGLGGLVVLQLALAVILVCGASLFLRSFTALAYRDLGFDRHRLLVSVVDTSRATERSPDRAALYERIRAAVAAAPGVEGAAVSLATPLGSAGVRITPEVTVPRTTPGGAETTRLLATPVSPGWFQTFGTRLLAGRDLGIGDRRGSPGVVVVNQAFARRFYGDATPLGQTVFITTEPNRRQPLEIVGLVEDAAFTSVREVVEPMIYLPLAQHVDEPVVTSVPSFSITVRAVDGLAPDGLAEPVARAIAAVDPAFTVFNQTVTLQLRHLYLRERLLASVSSAFGLLGLLLAAAGVYGVTAYAVRLRRQEIAIRMALGADRRAVLRLVFRRVAWRTATGVATGVMVSYWIAQFAETLLYGVDARDIATFLIAALALGGVALTAGWLPARSAASGDPATVLRDG